MNRDKIDSILELFNTVMDGYGIESIQFNGETICEYVNMGDTYKRTIIYDYGNDEFIQCDWGSFLEEFEEQYCKDNNLIKCAYCGSFHKLEDNKEWFKIPCKFNPVYCVDGSVNTDLKELEELNHES